MLRPPSPTAPSGDGSPATYTRRRRRSASRAPRHSRCGGISSPAQGSPRDALSRRSESRRPRGAASAHVIVTPKERRDSAKSGSPSVGPAGASRRRRQAERAAGRPRARRARAFPCERPTSAATGGRSPPLRAARRRARRPAATSSWPRRPAAALALAPQPGVLLCRWRARRRVGADKLRFPRRSDSGIARSSLAVQIWSPRGGNGGSGWQRRRRRQRLRRVEPKHLAERQAAEPAVGGVPVRRDSYTWYSSGGGADVGRAAPAAGGCARRRRLRATPGTTVTRW